MIAAPTIANRRFAWLKCLGFIVAGALACAVLLVVSGCESLNASRAQSPTGGMELTLYVRDATGAEMYYDIDRKGMLGFGGGMSARFQKTSWSGSLTAEEIQQLRTLLEERDWFRTRPESTDVPPEMMYRFSINAIENHTRFTVKGQCAPLEPVRELLAQASLRRLEPDLKTLPLPSSQR